MRPLWVTHPVYGCRLFQVGQWGMGEEWDQRGWSPLLHLDPVAHQRRSRRLLRQDLTFGQGCLSGKDTMGLFHRRFFRYVFFLVFFDFKTDHFLPKTVYEAQVQSAVSSYDHLFTLFSVSCLYLEAAGNHGREHYRMTSGPVPHTEAGAVLHTNTHIKPAVSMWRPG